MKNKTIQLKVRERLNKASSNDYDNIECWQVVEAFNKGMSGWCRRQIAGTNNYKTGDEQNTRRIDDLNVILKDKEITLKDGGLFYESDKLPEDFFEFKRVDADNESCDCPNPKIFSTYLAKEGNVNMLLRDENKKPSQSWGETFCTLIDFKLRIYTNGEMDFPNAKLTYYKQPLRIEIKGCKDPYTLEVSTADVECEFKDDVIELLIDEAVKILGGDIESFNASGIAGESVEINN